jgi:hypothetical protein
LAGHEDAAGIEACEAAEEVRREADRAGAALLEAVCLACLAVGLTGDLVRTCGDLSGQGIDGPRERGDRARADDAPRGGVHGVELGLDVLAHEPHGERRDGGGVAAREVVERGLAGGDRGEDGSLVVDGGVEGEVDSAAGEGRGGDVGWT